MRTEEKTKAYMQEYYAKNKQEISNQKKEYYEANKSRIQESSKEYKNKNKQLTKVQNKEYHKSKTLPYYIVYGLPNHFYCGITNQPEYRMRKHQSAEKRTTHNYFIMATAETKAEALEIEAEFHDAGWNGSAIHN